MSFILSAQREPETAAKAFDRYRAYLAGHAKNFPVGAHALATSDWYFDPKNHSCPHDAWLEGVTIAEPVTDGENERRVTTIRILLFGAYHDGFIELFYPEVFRYSLNSPSCVRGLGDWLYDEFRVGSDGHLIHEIEWAGSSNKEESRWIIEASDVEFQWMPK